MMYFCSVQLFTTLVISTELVKNIQQGFMNTAQKVSICIQKLSCTDSRGVAYR